ncbi:hypothetical protein RCL1_002598 [Eukaryota sp. TZLM3-RCL]
MLILAFLDMNSHLRLLRCLYFATSILHVCSLKTNFDDVSIEVDQEASTVSKLSHTSSSRVLAFFWSAVSSVVLILLHQKQVVTMETSPLHYILEAVTLMSNLIHMIIDAFSLLNLQSETNSFATVCVSLILSILILQNATISIYKNLDRETWVQLKDQHYVPSFKPLNSVHEKQLDQECHNFHKNQFMFYVGPRGSGKTHTILHCFQHKPNVLWLNGHLTIGSNLMKIDPRIGSMSTGARLALFSDLLANDQLTIIIDNYSHVIRTSVIDNIIKSSRPRTVIISDNWFDEFSMSKTAVTLFSSYFSQQVIDKILLHTKIDINQAIKRHGYDLESIVSKRNTDLECGMHLKKLQPLSNGSLQYLIEMFQNSTNSVNGTVCNFKKSGVFVNEKPVPLELKRLGFRCLESSSGYVVFAKSHQLLRAVCSLMGQRMIYSNFCSVFETCRFLDDSDSKNGRSIWI